MREQAAAGGGTTISTPFEYADNLVISVNVSNLERSIEWYRDMLGFPVTYRMDEYGWCEIVTPLPGVSIGLGQVEEPTAGGTTPTFGVKDIEAARRYLEGNGVRFDGETRDIEGQVKLATFFDPDGNSWMLAEVLAQDAGT